ncbi:DUF397 domain-containing protein [Streptomyces sp. TS71-3]|uniref:DUF397 domain-containing protein n=1 Tax=Streptomyces sp. TS71-3 TaxID=2733862 RepID=UPI001B111345|nr:DUF397 domain-containing protein [Streptomyces sp. TS71-3]GHJ40333.1 hypothetical protein Sm713_59420 [Streptomyces sp. TS71-3]
MNFRFTKSSFSALSGECLEVARNIPGVVAVRDSKAPGGSILRVRPEVWVAFVRSAGDVVPASSGT